jgi:septal ring factor EnvC (AmiA/AmiB activator)
MDELTEHSIYTGELTDEETKQLESLQKLAADLQGVDDATLEAQFRRDFDPKTRAGQEALDILQQDRTDLYAKLNQEFEGSF